MAGERIDGAAPAQRSLPGGRHDQQRALARKPRADVLRFTGGHRAYIVEHRVQNGIAAAERFKRRFAQRRPGLGNLGNSVAVELDFRQ